jgi:hypothetical protein
MSTRSPHELNERNALALVGLPWTELGDRGVGAGIRIGLSVGALGVCAAGPLLILGVVEVARGRVEEEFLFLGLALAGLAWCFLLYRIWAGYRQWRRMLRTVLMCVITWTAAGGVCALITSISHRAELLLGAVIVLALGITVALITAGIWDSKRARMIQAPEARVRIHCPSCGYSMAGLERCVCPECGQRFTLDALIRAQNYSGREAKRVVVESPEEAGRNALPASQATATS